MTTYRIQEKNLYLQKLGSFRKGPEDFSRPLPSATIYIIGNAKIQDLTICPGIEVLKVSCPLLFLIILSAISNKQSPKILLEKVVKKADISLMESSSI
jgi:hypothetical protein